MGKLTDIKVPIDFDETPTHTVEFDPNADTRIMKGQNGEYDAIPVKENGKVFYLALSNKSLLRQLQAIPSPVKLVITRKGTGFDTEYEVKQVK